MKSLFLFLTIILSSCEKVIHIELPNPDSQIVIDGQLLTRKGSEIDNGVISTTIQFANQFFDNEVRFIDDAEVFLTNTSNGRIIKLDNEYNSLGHYRPSEIAIIIDKNAEYELTLNFENQVYKAKNKWLPAPKIDSIVNIGEIKLYGTERIELKVYFQDIPNETNYYIFNLQPYLQNQIFEDRFFQDKQFNFSIYPLKSQLLENEGRIFVKCKGIDVNYYNFYTKLIELKEPSISGPFETPRPHAQGNIINTTDQNQPPFGYFIMAEEALFIYELQN